MAARDARIHELQDDLAITKQEFRSERAKLEERIETLSDVSKLLRASEKAMWDAMPASPSLEPPTAPKPPPPPSPTSSGPKKPDPAPEPDPAGQSETTDKAPDDRTADRMIPDVPLVTSPALPLPAPVQSPTSERGLVEGSYESGVRLKDIDVSFSAMPLVLPAPGSIRAGKAVAMIYGLDDRSCDKVADFLRRCDFKDFEEEDFCELAQRLDGAGRWEGDHTELAHGFCRYEKTARAMFANGPGIVVYDQGAVRVLTWQEARERVATQLAEEERQRSLDRARERGGEILRTQLPLLLGTDTWLNGRLPLAKADRNSSSTRDRGRRAASPASPRLVRCAYQPVMLPEAISPATRCRIMLRYDRWRSIDTDSRLGFCTVRPCPPHSDDRRASRPLVSFEAGLDFVGGCGKT
jgi:hypothetical protein